MDAKDLKIRSILQKLSGNKKRKRDDPNNPLVAYCKALFIPHFHSDTEPDIPFDEVQTGVYNVEGNPPHKLLQLHKNHFEFI